MSAPSFKEFGEIIEQTPQASFKEFGEVMEKPPQKKAKRSRAGAGGRAVGRGGLKALGNVLDLLMLKLIPNGTPKKNFLLKKR